MSFGQRTGAIVLMLMCAVGLFAQHTYTVRGFVCDAHTRKPLAAAQISVLNNVQSASSDDKGSFKIVLSSPTAILQIKAFDYNLAAVACRGNDSIVVKLYPDVFGNYYKNVEGLTGMTPAISATNSTVGSVNVSKSNAFTADQLLLTEMGGDTRSVSRSAQIGQGVSSFIRGLNSVFANAQPLYVVDGVIWNNFYDVVSLHQGLQLNPLTNIDMDDIESISVVKDGTSLYGTKGANGVILIKTKRANEMATRIDFSSVTGLSAIPSSFPMLNSSDYRIYASEMLSGAGYSNAEISQMAFLNDDKKRTTYNQYHNNTDWTKEVYRKAVSQSYSINVRGGDEKALYYFALGYTKNNGVVKSTDFQRYTLRYNGDINMTRNIKLAVNVGFARVDRNVVDDGTDAYSSPTWLSKIKSPIFGPNTFTFAGDRTTEYAFVDFFNIGNPSGLIDKLTNTVKQNNFNITLKPIWQLSKKWQLSTNFDYALNKINEDNYRPKDYTTEKFVDGIGLTHNSRGSQVIRNTSVFNDLRGVYTTKIDKFDFVALAGNRFRTNRFESDYLVGYNSGSNTSINLPGSFSYLRSDGTNNNQTTISNYLNLDWTYDNRYYLTMTTSLDASSRFGSQTQSGFSVLGVDWAVSPAVSASWLVSSEQFMKKVRLVNLLKLRAGYGITGNDDIKDYQTEAYFTGVRFKGVYNGMVLSNLANPKIQWEKTARANAGVDVALLNDRLNLSLDVYSSVTTHLLVQKQFQDAVGLNSYWTNDGKLGNKGFELTMNAKVINLSTFHWELGASMGHYRNEILSLSGDPIHTQVLDGEVITQVGSAAGLFYGYKTEGVYSTVAEAANANLQTITPNGTYAKFGAGDVRFVDVVRNGVKDGIIDANDKQVIGNPNPDLYGSFTNKFSYKNLMLTALFTFSYGNDVYNYQRSLLESGKDFSNQTLSMLNRWTSENQVTNQPRATYGDPMGNARFSDRWIEDGSYLRLKSLILSYNLPVKSRLLQSINVWASANNLLTFTKYLGLDPEFSNQNSVLYQGVDAGMLSAGKSYNVGVKFSL
jgi:TonB-linked SusC/RagA family outer membrane protein